MAVGRGADRVAARARPGGDAGAGAGARLRRGALQIAEDARRDIEQRKASARQFYRGAAGTDEAVIAALRDVEPANAQALAASWSAPAPFAPPMTASRPPLRCCGL